MRRVLAWSGVALLTQATAAAAQPAPVPPMPVQPAPVPPARAAGPAPGARPLVRTASVRADRVVTEVVRRTPGDTVGNSYRVYRPAGLPRGRARALLVLVPGYPGHVDSYDPVVGSEPSTLPARLAARGIATVVAVADPLTLYADEGALRRLDAIVAEARARYAAPGAPVAVGGFSAGGTGAVRFAERSAERCAAHACGSNPPVAAVFAVDAPLDFARVWRQTALALRRGDPRANAAEGRLVLAALRRALGGPPEAAPAAYRRASPLLAAAVDGGNARWLRATPLRTYTEPDVQWWLANRAADYAGMNATDAAALVNVARIGGNARAALVTTVGRGVRPGGRRHPHAWAIVDEAELAGWLAGLLTPGA